MDLWLECIDNGIFTSIQKGREYQVIDIDPLRGLVLIINDLDEKVWYFEERFKAKREEEKIMKKNYLPIIVEVNVVGKVAGIEIIQLDKNLPEIKSMNEFLNVSNLFGIDMRLEKGPNDKVAILINDGYENEVPNIYDNNIQALDAASRITKAIDLYNSLLIKTEYIAKKKAYLVQFNPKGKKYEFRSNHELTVGETVICHSVTGNQYAVICGTIEIPIEDWEKRALCSPNR